MSREKKKIERNSKLCKYETEEDKVRRIQNGVQTPAGVLVRKTPKIYCPVTQNSAQL